MVTQVGRERFLQGRDAENIPILIHVKTTPGAVRCIRASFSEEDEKHPQGSEKHPAGLRASFAAAALSL